ncbi:hypothetical protein BG003_008046 [Podila horticola]|nr:hypothetical protein BG003_008046 [Podila horticola]
MALTRPHLLDTPEIVHSVGLFLPWVPDSDVEEAIVFCPANLVASVRVNRLWHRTLTPVLWMNFDAEWASLRRIPQHVIMGYSCHFRYARLNTRVPVPVLHSNQLRELAVKYIDPMAICFLTQYNPSIGHLAIGLFNNSILISLELILEPLTHLKHLEIQSTLNTTVTLSQILLPLRQLTKLTHLRLLGFEVLQNVNLVPITHGDAATPGTASQPTLSSITDLFLDYKWRGNNGLEFLRSLPTLEYLTINLPSSKNTRAFPSGGISSQLRRHCPRLTSIKCVEPRFLDLGHHQHLLNSTSNLSEYNLPVARFNSVFCNALLMHAASLETVYIHCDSVSEDEIRNASQILTSCPNLQSFVLYPRNRLKLSEAVLALFGQPWNCPNLRELELHGYKPEKTEEQPGAAKHGSPDGNAPMDANSEAEAGLDWTRLFISSPVPGNAFYETLAQEGWTTKTKNKALKEIEKESSRLVKVVHGKVFDRVLRLPRMRMVTLEECVFIKKGRFMYE